MDVGAREDLVCTAVAHASELARFFKSRVSDEHDAQDLMQELYLALLKIPGSQKVVRHPKAYLFTIAGNLLYQHWQRSKALPPHVKLDEVSTEVLHTAHATSEANVPESEAALSQQLLALHQRLSELSPKVQAAVVWHHRDGYTCDEIAEKLSVVTHRVKKYLVRGLNHCREVAAASEIA
jgi:RNA polymerase sigma factor (sigma-70 family)